MKKLSITLVLVLTYVLGLNIAFAAPAPKKPADILLPIGTLLHSNLISDMPINPTQGSTFISKVSDTKTLLGDSVPYLCHIISTTTLLSKPSEPLVWTLKPTSLHCINTKLKKPLPPIPLTGTHTFNNKAFIQPPAFAETYLSRKDTLGTLLTKDITLPGTN